MAATPERTGARLVAADRVEGTEVYNPEGEKLGEVKNLFIDKVSGQAEFATMSFGGFLGVGEKRHPIPWDALTYDPERGGFVVDIDKEVLKGAPAYDDMLMDEPEQEWREEVRTYYAGRNIGLI